MILKLLVDDIFEDCTRAHDCCFQKKYSYCACIHILSNFYGTSGFYPTKSTRPESNLQLRFL